MKSKKNVTYVQKSFFTIKMKKRNLKYAKKLEIIVINTGKFRGAAHSICNLNYKVPQEIPVKIHNGSKHDYDFIIRELAEEFNGQFHCLGENTEKYITFSVPVKEENDNHETITYKIKYIDTCRFMQSKLSYLADNLSEIIKPAKNAQKETKLDQNVNLLG